MKGPKPKRLSILDFFGGISKDQMEASSEGLESLWVTTCVGEGEDVDFVGCLRMSLVLNVEARSASVSLSKTVTEA